MLDQWCEIFIYLHYWNMSTYVDYDYVDDLFCRISKFRFEGFGIGLKWFTDE